MKRTIAGRSVSAIGVGTVKVSVIAADFDAGVRTLCAALDAGITVVDTAAAYVPSASEEDAGHNERIVAAALKEWGGDPDSITIVTKGGHKRIANDMSREAFSICGTAEFVREQAEGSVRALGRVPDVYLLHWPDPNTPITESMEALVALVDAGLAHSVGLSNVSVEQLDAASGIGTVAAVQNSFAPGRTDSEPVLRRCEELGTAFMAYSPLHGTFAAKKLGEAVPPIAAVAEELGVSPQRVALAWSLAKSEAMIPVVGASRPESILDSAAAVGLELSRDQMARIDQI